MFRKIGNQFQYLLPVLRGLVLLTMFMSAQALAQESCPTNTNSFEQTYQSGASWNLCWRIDDNVGLTLSEMYYTAPGYPARKVMEQANIAGLMLHFDEDVNEINLLDKSALGGNSALTMNQDNCFGSVVNSNSDSSTLCVDNRIQGNLTRFADLPVLKRQVTTLSYSAKINSYTFNSKFSLTEDGKIKPAMDFSGRIARFTDKTDFGNPIDNSLGLASNASFYYVWRLDFNINNTPNNDIIDEYQFEQDQTDRGRKLQTKTRLSVEQLRKTDPEKFRGWQIYDAEQSSVEGGFTRIGYYLDPQSSGFSYANANHNWAQFDFFLTVNKACEQLALTNADLNTPEEDSCGKNLDEYINGELTEAQDPVIWFSLTRRFTPHAADWPAINTRSAEFSLIPFDWTATSPFSDVLTELP